MAGASALQLCCLGRSGRIGGNAAFYDSSRLEWPGASMRFGSSWPKLTQSALHSIDLIQSALP